MKVIESFTPIRFFRRSSQRVTRSSNRRTWFDDPRVSFVKGWFQNTWDELKGRLDRLDNLIVHYDADLYSSTLFALTKIDSLKLPYFAIFDEFAGHEARALHNYLQSYNASAEFLGKTIVDGYPVAVMSRITLGAG
jgi:Macrocin-O-methyltransferase (TylF)